MHAGFSERHNQLQSNDFHRRQNAGGASLANASPNWLTGHNISFTHRLCGYEVNYLASLLIIFCVCNFL